MSSSTSNRIKAYTGKDAETKLALPVFLRMLTTHSDLDMQTAMTIAGKVFKTHNTPGTLSTLSNVALEQLGVSNKEHRKQALAAIKKMGWTPELPSKVLISPPAVALKPSKVRGDKQPTAKRKRTDEDDEDGPRRRHAGANAGHTPGPHAFEYNENVDEKSLASKVIIINRAPVMTAWAAVVAERLKFTRAEALSIASVYTEMNASSKGVALGIFHKDKDSDFEGGSTQPYVELMGRKPVMKTDAGEWRGIVKGEAAEPEMAYGYIQRSFKHLMGSVIGSMRLLQESYSPEELNKNGYDLYCQFRPGQGDWGQRGEMRMKTLLDLRR
ncbi:uncharacterized protein EI90DRAFT_2913877 [Cantharellus anzutake]|uniref:uncharacterized protein n=1 Tax=Cantharellus anzutake TaxID=1750568 RepID=UPI0019075C0C|nr:uncharacterized protein EI90DRAFT_2913877 [Cantharellus anzutake]KAF8335018.1 hypothetical protein EI90DRAFT_2913877 [Cantharellus anzutake]